MFSKEKRIQMLIQENNALYKQIRTLNDQLDFQTKENQELKEQIKRIKQDKIERNYEYAILNNGFKTEVYQDGLAIRCKRIDFTQEPGELPEITLEC